MRERLEIIHRATGGELVVGTGRSGTDGVAHAFELVMRWWRETFGLVFALKHKVSCEIKAWKVEFIRQHFNPEEVFPDLRALGETMAENYEGV